MSNEKLREEFEAWFSVNVPDINNLAAARAVKHMMIKELAFLTWQASRECLVIELPKRGPSFTVGGVTSFSLKNEGRNEAIKEIEVSIHAVGVKTK